MDDSTRVPEADDGYRYTADGRYKYMCRMACYRNCTGDDNCMGDRFYIVGDIDHDPVYSKCSLF